MHLLCARHCAKGCALVVTNVTMTLYTIKPDEIQKGCYEYLPKVPDLHVVDLGYEHGGLMPKPMSSATPWFCVRAKVWFLFPLIFFPPLCSLIQGGEEKQSGDMAVFSPLLPLHLWDTLVDHWVSSPKKYSLKADYTSEIYTVLYTAGSRNLRTCPLCSWELKKGITEIKTEMYLLHMPQITWLLSLHPVLL